MKKILFVRIKRGNFELKNEISLRPIIVILNCVYGELD